MIGEGRITHLGDGFREKRSTGDKGEFARAEHVLGPILLGHGAQSKQKSRKPGRICNTRGKGL